MLIWKGGLVNSDIVILELLIRVSFLRDQLRVCSIPEANLQDYLPLNRQYHMHHPLSVSSKNFHAAECPQHLSFDYPPCAFTSCFTFYAPLW
jgi:hypothetical protein